MTAAAETTELAVRPAGAVAPAKPPGPALFSGFEGAAAQPFDDYARLILAEPVDPRDVEIRTDGIVYLSGVWYRRQLTRAFGAGGWAIVPRSPPQKMGEMVVYHGALIVLGRFVSEAMGECETRAKMSYASSLEGARTDCITRCCKDLGMASELWDRTWRDAWIRDCAKQVPDKRDPSKMLWYKRDGAEHDMVPLFVRQPLSPEAAVPKPASPPSSSAAPPPAPSPPGETKRRDSGAKDIKHDGSRLTPGQNDKIHALRAKSPTLSATPEHPNSSWKKKLAPYKKQDGTPCQHSNELSYAQASHLIDWLQAKADALDAKEREIRSGNDRHAPPPPVVTPADLLEELHAQFTTAEEEDKWLRGLGWSCADDIPEESRSMVVALLKSLKRGPSAYATELTKARALGHIR